MRYKIMAVLAAVAMPLLALTGQARAATARPAIPLAQVCAAGEFQAELVNTNQDSVAQWNVSHNSWYEEASGHTIVCQKNKKLIGGVPYWEYAAVLNGSESNDCLSIKNGVNQPLGLNGCSAGTGYLLWAQIQNCDTAVSVCVVSDNPGPYWVHSYFAGYPLYAQAPSNSGDFDWQFLPG